MSQGRLGDDLADLENIDAEDLPTTEIEQQQLHAVLSDQAGSLIDILDKLTHLTHTLIDVIR